MGFAFPGGIEKVAIDDTGAFDTAATTDPSTFLIEVERNNIAKEGTDIPDPEAITAALADDRESRMGLNQSLALRLADLPTTDFDTLEGACDDGTEVYVKVTSMAKTSGGTPKWEVVYQRVLLSNVAHGPANVDRSAYGVVIVDGMCTGFSTSDIYTLTQGT